MEDKLSKKMHEKFEKSKCVEVDNTIDHEQEIRRRKKLKAMRKSVGDSIDQELKMKLLQQRCKIVSDRDEYTHYQGKEECDDDDDHDHDEDVDVERERKIFTVVKQNITKANTGLSDNKKVNYTVKDTKYNQLCSKDESNTESEKQTSYTDIKSVEITHLIDEDISELDRCYSQPKDEKVSLLDTGSSTTNNNQTVMRERKIKKSKEIVQNLSDKVKSEHKNRNCCDEFCSIQ